MNTAQDTLLKRYRYRPKPWTMTLVIVFFAACAAGLTNVAQTNDRGAVIDRLITLNTSQATGLYWVLAACSVGFVILGIIGIINAYTKELFVEITGNSITIPAMMLRKQAYIPFREITDMYIQNVQRQVFLTMVYAGKKISLVRGHMPSKADFEEASALIASKVGQPT